MRDDTAVSATIAVVLLVAITVVLSAIVYFAVTDTSSNSGDTPIANIGVEPGASPTAALDSSLLVLSHRGGDCYELPELRFSLDRGGLVPLTFTDADGKFCVGETLALDEASATDFTALDSGAKYELVIIDEVTELIVLEQLVSLA